MLVKRVANGKAGTVLMKVHFQVIGCQTWQLFITELGTIWHQKPKRAGRFPAKPLKRMVGVTRIELVTPTMST